MGRIAHEGEVLVDVEEATTILKKSRRTVFSLIKSGRLQSIKVKGSKKTWLKVMEVEGVAEIPNAIGSPESTKEPSHWKHLRRWHPQVYARIMKNHSGSSPK